MEFCFGVCVRFGPVWTGVGVCGQVTTPEVLAVSTALTLTRDGDEGHVIKDRIYLVTLPS